MLSRRDYCTAARLATLPTVHFLNALRVNDLESAQPLLGGRTPAGFMSRHWQKKPLLIRHACLDFNGAISRDRLMALACGDEVESRLVIRERGRFSLATGP